ncbi:MAG: sulfate permease [Chloroflexi bacterium]|nr:sulfate permease [Chloroflexota bacterium]
MLYYLQRPVRLFRTYDKENFRPDLIAGITVGVILLPQAIAFAIIADLPPEMGLYAAVVGAFIGALWGSSDQIHTGPTNANSLLIFGALAGIATAGTAEFIVAAGLMAVMVGVMQLLIGLARLGVVVNFVSHSVIVGFATGGGILIGINQFGPLVKLTLPREHIHETIITFFTSLPDAHTQSAMMGVGTMIVIVLLQRFAPRVPASLTSMVLASIVVFALRLDQQGVAVIGQLPSGLPPFVALPIFDLELIGRLSPGALAVGSISLVQSIAISRTVAAQTGQRLDSNQEFVGLGIANIFAGFFSGFSIAGSLSRTAANYEANAKSPMASIISAIFVLVAMLVLGPLAAYLPRSALAGVLIVIAYNMIDREEIKRIWKSKGGDAAIMAVTMIGTLLLPIEVAVLIGILLSLTLYVLRTSTPKVHAVVPDKKYRHFFLQPDKEECPQLGIIEILGDLYFGAVHHVEEFILDHLSQKPEQRYLVIRMHNVNHCDFSGIHMLENIVRIFRERGGDIFLVRVNPRVYELMESTNFDSLIGTDHLLDEDEVIDQTFHHVLDPAICIYECPVRVFKECQNLPKRNYVAGIPRLSEVPKGSVMTVSASVLWEQIHDAENDVKPFVVDVREPREFKQNHIIEANLIPLSKILAVDVKLPNDQPIVLVCRSGRRSRRAAYALQGIGCMNVSILEGGMVEWEATGLLEAVA